MACNDSNNYRRNVQETLYLHFDYAHNRRKFVRTNSP